MNHTWNEMLQKGWERCHWNCYYVPVLMAELTQNYWQKFSMKHRLESCARVCSYRPYECLNFQKYSAAVAAVCCAEFFKCISSKPLLCYLTLLNLSFFFCNEMEAKMKVFLMPIDQEWCSLFIDIFQRSLWLMGRASTVCPWVTSLEEFWSQAETTKKSTCGLLANPTALW